MMKWTVVLMLIVFSLSNCDGDELTPMTTDKREHQKIDQPWRRVMEAEMRQLKNRVKQLESFNHIIRADCCKSSSATAASDGGIGPESSQQQLLKKRSNEII